MFVSTFKNVVLSFKYISVEQPFKRSWLNKVDIPSLNLIPNQSIWIVTERARDCLFGRVHIHIQDDTLARLHYGTVSE